MYNIYIRLLLSEEKLTFILHDLHHAWLCYVKMTLLFTFRMLIGQLNADQPIETTLIVH